MANASHSGTAADVSQLDSLFSQALAAAKKNGNTWQAAVSSDGITRTLTVTVSPEPVAVTTGQPVTEPQ